VGSLTIKEKAADKTGQTAKSRGTSTLCSTTPCPTVIVMARITVEDCLGKGSSRFDLVLLASIRAKQLLKGAKPLIQSDNRDIVIALREIAAGKVRWAILPRT
jgi:DNA-directed RNA polymerase omega subunit